MTCLSSSCKWRPPGECVYYSGDHITGYNISSGDNLNVVIQKITTYLGVQGVAETPNSKIDSNSIAFTLSGVANRTLKADVRRDSQVDNKLSIGVNGLYVAPATFSGNYDGSDLTLTVDGHTESFPLTSNIVSVFGRTGAILAQAGDYTWAQIGSKPTTLAGLGVTDPVVLTSGAYANPAWITSLDKAKVGLSGVDNTPDLDKPISTATQAALNLKANINSPALTGVPTAPTASVAADDDQIATTAFVHDLVAAVSSGVTTFNGRSGAVMPALNDYTWAQVNKATSSLADITTRSAAALSSGTLADARLSANVPLLDINNTFTGNMTVNGTFTNSTVAKITTLAGLRAETSTSSTQRWFTSDLGQEGFWYYDSTDSTSADDTGMILVAGATRRYKRIVQDEINVKWFGAKGDNSTDDTVAIQNCFNWVQNHATKTLRVIFPAGDYKQTAAVELPHVISTTAESIHIEIVGYGARIFSTTAGITLWSRMPADQNEALNILISRWIGHIRGFVFDGAGGASNTQTGMRIGALYSWTVEDCNFNYFDTGLISEFALSCTYRNLRFAANNVNSFVGKFGTWSSATNSNSAFNANTIENVRVGNKSGSNSAYFVDGGNGNYVRNFISEGAKPVYHFLMDSDASAVIKQNIFDNIWIEANGGVTTNAVNFRFIANRGATYVKNVHLDYADMLFDFSGGSQGRIVFDGIYYTGALPTPCFNSGTSSAVLGYDIIFRNMGGPDAFFTKLYNTASWVGGTIPLEIHYDYEKQSGSGISAYSAGGNIDLEPGQASSAGSRAVKVYGKFYAISLTEQLKLEYNASNYFGITVGSTGIATLTPTGTAAAIVLPAATSIGPVSATELGYLDGVTGALQGQIDAKSPTASPTFTGVPAAPTAAVDTNTTQIATTAYVVGQGYAKLAGPTFTGVPAAPTAAVDTNTTQLATTAYVVGQGYAKLASPTFTGTPALPTGTTGVTQSAGDNSTKLATTAFVFAERTGAITLTSKTLTDPILTSQTTNPSAPAAGLKMWSHSYGGGREMLRTIGQDGRVTEYVPWSMTGTFGYWQAAGATTAPIMGNMGGTGTGTPTARTVANTNVVTQVKRISYVSAATAGASAGLHNNSDTWWRGDATGKGGFFLAARFTIASTVAGQRGGFFLHDVAGGGAVALVNADPSSFTDFCGFGFDAAHTNLWWMHNDGAGAAATTDLGANFPCRTDQADLYEARMWCVPNDTAIYYWIKNITNGSIASGSSTTDIIANNLFMRWELYINNGAVASAVTLDICSVYSATPY